MIVNLLPHPIYIIGNAVYSPSIRKHIVPDGQEPEIILTIPSATTVNARFKTVQLPPFEGCPRGKKEVRGCDGLPKVEDPENTIFIVSAPYAQAYKIMHPKYDVSNMYVVGEKVYDTNGQKMLGTLRILQCE
jgi:hypothetical protein